MRVNESERARERRAQTTTTQLHRSRQGAASERGALAQ